MKTIDISGFGDSYEAGCQKMLLQGLRFLDDHPSFDWSGYYSYKNIYGICEATSDEAKALDSAICQGVEPSGAMHQGVVNHLAYIHKHGYESWLAEAEKKGREIYEISEGEIDKTLLISKIEWQLKLDSGYNPMAELFKQVPKENIISVDSNNPESVKSAAEQIARIIGGEK